MLPYWLPKWLLVNENCIIPSTSTGECLCVKLSGAKLSAKEENTDIISDLKELIVK